MTMNTQIEDQEDVLAASERLQADNTRLTGELQAANELLETAQTGLTEANNRADELSARVTTLETEAQTREETVNRLTTEITALTTRMADFNKAVAAEVIKLGLNPNAADHKEAPADADLTPTQRVLAAKGVNTIAELRK